jgi:transcriptional regulator with XRE-family HTH domain
MSERDHVSGRQIAAARTMLGLNQDELARRANISVPTLRRMEAGIPVAAGLPNNVAAVRAVLETEGITFTFDASGPLGVEHRRPEGGSIYSSVRLPRERS